MRARNAIAVLASLLLLVPTAGRASAEPGYSVPEETLLRALTCTAEFTHLETREPVLLVHGTSAIPEEAWSWNYVKTLPALGFDACYVRLPNRAFSDQQESAEFVVYAIKWMRARSSDRKIDVVGHSQGGLLPRWAIKWWPSLQSMVDDFVPLAAPAHGASGADTLCPGSCAPSVQQMKSGSQYLAALNRGDETPGPVDYTSVFSLADELVQPYTSPPLSGGTNIAVQDVCPGRPVHHYGHVYDAVVFALVMDAFTHPGPADVSRLPSDVCARTWMPGVTNVDVATGNVSGYGNAYLEFGSYPGSDREPELKPYARG